MKIEETLDEDEETAEEKRLKKTYRRAGRKNGDERTIRRMEKYVGHFE